MALSYLLFRSTLLGCTLQGIREERGRYQGVFVQMHFSVGVNTSDEEVLYSITVIVWGLGRVRSGTDAFCGVQRIHLERLISMDKTYHSAMNLSVKLNVSFNVT
jgi:hypothetical protein